MNKPIGTHIMGDLSMCDSNFLFSLNMEETKKKVCEIITKYNFTVLGNYFHLFDNNSFTGVVALSESHVSMHTWPELGVVNIDVYTCNYQNDNTQATENVFAEISALFQPGEIQKKTVRR